MAQRKSDLKKSVATCGEYQLRLIFKNSIGDELATGRANEKGTKAGEER
jgi:hypothetical protein